MKELTRILSLSKKDRFWRIWKKDAPKKPAAPGSTPPATPKPDEARQPQPA